ncbi:helix-turn-helix domain-containing protein, partial [Candidatus Micrarchaeota archaeon]|nr:helix-turn-helix domain-containing protein [Candidatus Micrarchaeota archaeon]
MKEIDVSKLGSLRRKLGITQKELAKLAGVSQSLIAKIEMGKIDPAYSKVLA